MIRENFGQDAQMVGAEIGVWDGKLSETLFKTFPNLTLIMIDPWELHGGDNPTMPGTKDQYEGARNAAASRTEQWKDRRIVRQGFSPDVISDLVPAIRLSRLDWAFIDGDHMYDGVAADIQGWWPLIRRGGVLSGHDYAGKGDRRHGWGVQRAVDEFARANELEVHLPGGLVWWIKKPED
jgi:hypothetical protein